MNNRTIKRFFSLFLVLILCAAGFSLCACEKESENIVKVYDSPLQVSQVTGISPVEYVPNGYKAVAYRSVYDIVSETEYAPVVKQDSDSPVIAVFRIVDAAFNTSNLSGFEDTALSEVYYPASRTDLSLSIEARDEFLAVEWQDSFGGKKCKLSLSLTNGTVEEFKKLIDGALEYIAE